VREALPGMVALLVREFGVRRVTLFGSLLHSTPSERPNIDLVVEGRGDRCEPAGRSSWSSILACSAAGGSGAPGSRAPGDRGASP
jgi:hypothetical protein